MTKRTLSDIKNESFIEVQPINNTKKRRRSRRRKNYPYTITQFHKVREDWFLSYKEMFIEEPFEFTL